MSGDIHLGEWAVNFYAIAIKYTLKTRLPTALTAELQAYPWSGKSGKNHGNV